LSFTGSACPVIESRPFISADAAKSPGRSSHASNDSLPGWLAVRRMTITWSGADEKISRR
jgi:hypothetical protein